MKFLPYVVILALLTLPTVTEAKSSVSNERSYALAVEEKKVKLSKLLNAVSKKTSKQFMVHANSRSEVVAYGIEEENVNYNELLSIIDLNGMAAVEIEGIVNILPVSLVKQYPVPQISAGDKLEHGNLWVTKIIDTGSLSAGEVLPLLRSLVRVDGHMASHGRSHSIILVAPYNSVVRVENIIRELDQANSKATNKAS
ncbi:hypothetical protein [Aliikangiella sp. G2MR2-5]|uniref:hypothetical protein n=1 Tax=Aliikangiella sp. G2MR2-5 TaxID=2788943 RepID=UPI0018A929F1|nr:hypothetical protein [Aliikangiella sp. G2MR2-5]